MKTQSKPSASGTSRFLKGFIAIVGLAAAAPSFAGPQGQVSVFLAGEKFGNNLDINVNSAPRQIVPAKAYKYNLTGKVKVSNNSPLKQLIPDGTPIAQLVESLSPGGSSFLSGTFDNPSRNLPVTLMNKTFTRTRTIPNFGTVKISFKVFGEIQGNGTCVMKVTDVIVKSNPRQNLGTIQFMKGSKLSISAAPEVEFKKSNTNVSEADGSVSVPVWRTTNAKGSVTVDFTTVDGSADSADYTPTSGTVTFADGELTKNIVIPVTNNGANDGGRFFTIQISNPGNGAKLGSRTSTKVTITDDD